MDRSGYERVSQEDFWQCYEELNPITVSGFEAELRMLEFEFHRVAVRTQDLVEYSHPQLQNYPIADLATVEIYISAINRKKPRPEGFSTEPMR